MAADEFSVKLNRRYIPAAELVADVQRVAGMLGRTALSRAAYDRHGTFSSETVCARLGGWTAATLAAGLEPARRPHVSEADLFENLATVWRTLGRQPVQHDMHPATGPTRYDLATYSRHFGSWNRALQWFAAQAHASGIGTLTQTSKAETATTAPGELPPERPTAGATASGDTSQGLSTGRSPSPRLRARILLRDLATCQLCGANPATVPGTVLHVDHIVPWSKGGATEEANLRTLCAACNLGKSDELPTATGTTDEHGWKGNNG